MNKTALYFDDIQVGQKFLSDTYLFTEENIIAFAKQFDPQPFHLSAEGGKNSLFGGLVASGWHIGSASMRLIIGDDAPIAGGLVSRGGEVQWRLPARPNDKIHVETVIKEKILSKSKPSQGTVIVESVTYNQKGEVIQILKANLIVPVK